MDRRNFFISFNSADLAYAEAIDAALRAANFTTYYHPRDLGPGGNVPMWMDDALMNSAQTLALYSPDYTKDTAVYSKAERYASWWQDPLSDKRKLIPILLHDTKFTPLMAMISRIDVVSKTPQEAVAHVVARLREPQETKQRDHWRLRQPLPEIFSAAYRPNPNFTGRFEALESSVQSLREGSNAAITAVAGMGGVGKTTLAAEYCHRFGGQYGGVWWIRAEQESIILSDLRDLGQKLGLEAKQNVEEAARECLAHLASQTRPWLLVYDNAPNPDSVRNHLPSGAVRCVITSRFTEFGGIAPVVPLDKWPNEVTRDYLLSRTERDDKDGAERLADTLDGLPLAAEQAAVFLKTRKGLSFDDYATDIAQLIKQPRPAGAKGEYPDTVYAAFVKSLEAVKEMLHGETALHILQLCAFLSPDGVDLRLLTVSGNKVLPAKLASAIADKFRREDALSALASLSLLRREDRPRDDILIFHRLLLAVARDWMGEAARVLWSGAAVRLVDSLFPRGSAGSEFDIEMDTSVWPICARLITHVQFFKDHAFYYAHESTKLNSLLHYARGYLVGIGDFQGALSLAEATVMLTREMDKPLQLAADLKNLADRYFDLGRLKEAEDSVREALQLQGSLATSPTDPAYIGTVQTLAEILAQKKDFAESEKYFLVLENVTRTVSGEQSFQRGLILNAFGELYSIWANETGNKEYFLKAMVCAEEALTIARAIHGERHPTTANRITFFSMKNVISGNWKGAEIDIEKSVAIMLSLGLPEHPFARESRDALISSWRRFGQSEKTKRFLSGDLSDLLPVIRQVEAEHHAWVAQDPKKRHFGPPSFFERMGQRRK